MILLSLTIFILIYIFIVNKFKKHIDLWKQLQGIPGPSSVPFLGTNYKRLTLEKIHLREKERMQKYYPIYKSRVFLSPFVHIAGPEDVQLILGNSAHNTKGTSQTFLLKDLILDGLIISTGSKWHKRRKMLSQAFDFNLYQNSLPIIFDLFNDLVKDLRYFCDQPYNIEEYIKQFTIRGIGGSLLGLSTQKNSKLTEYLQNISDYIKCFRTRINNPWLLLPFIFQFSVHYKKFKRTIKNMHGVSEYIYNERKKTFDIDHNTSKKSLPLIDLLLNLEHSKHIDKEGVLEELHTTLGAGTESTSTCLQMTLMLIANNKDIQKDLYQEITSVLGNENKITYAQTNELKLMGRCIKESLRMYPPFPTLNRIVGKEIITKSGYRIPEGCDVLIHIIYMHRNPLIWDNPDKFDPNRFLPECSKKRHPYAFIPFGAGGRACIGQKFAIMQIKMLLIKMLRNFILEPVDTPENIKLFYQPTLNPIEGVKIKLIPRG